MKKTYIAPNITMLALNSCDLCTDSATKWHVDAPSGEHEHAENDNNWGNINYDKGAGSYDDDPWNSANW